MSSICWSISVVDADDDAALVDAFDVVTAPGESVGTVCWDVVSDVVGIV